MFLRKVLSTAVVTLRGSSTLRDPSGVVPAGFLLWAITQLTPGFKPGQLTPHTQHDRAERNGGSGLSNLFVSEDYMDSIVGPQPRVSTSSSEHLLRKCHSLGITP